MMPILAPGQAVQRESESRVSQLKCEATGQQSGLDPLPVGEGAVRLGLAIGLDEEAAIVEVLDRLDDGAVDDHLAGSCRVAKFDMGHASTSTSMADRSW